MDTGARVPPRHPKGQGANRARRSHYCRRTSQNPAALASGTKRGLGSSLRRPDTLSRITPKPQNPKSPNVLLSVEAAPPKPLTGLNDSGLVAGTHRQHLEHPARGPQQLLVVVAAHDLHQGLGSSVGQNNQLRGKGDRVRGCGSSGHTSPAHCGPPSCEVGWGGQHHPRWFGLGTKPQHPAPRSHARLQRLERRRRAHQPRGAAQEQRWSRCPEQRREKPSQAALPARLGPSAPAGTSCPRGVGRDSAADSATALPRGTARGATRPR